MWKIVRSEFIYNKFSMIFLYVFILTIFSAVFASGWSSAEQDVPGLTTIMGVTLMVIHFLKILSRFTREKFDRIFIMLPISMFKIAVARLLFIITNWTILLLLFWLGLLIFRMDSFEMWIFWFMASITGIILSINAWPVIHRDLLFYLKEQYQKIILSIIYAAIFLCGSLILTSDGIHRYFPTIPLDSLLIIREKFGSFISSPIGALNLFAIGVGLSIFSVFIFHKRKFYLE